MVGKKIKSYLDTNGIKQSYVAREINMQISTFNSIMQGNRNLLVEEYFEICKVLNVPNDMFQEKSIA